MVERNFIKVDRLVNIVKKFQKKNIQQFFLAYAMIMNPDNLVDIINQQELKNNIEDREKLIHLLNQTIAIERQKILKSCRDQCKAQMEIECLTNLPQTLTYGELNYYSKVDLPEELTAYIIMPLMINELAKDLRVSRFHLRWKEKLAEEILFQFIDQKVQYYYFETIQTSWQNIQDYVEKMEESKQFLDN